MAKTKRNPIDTTGDEATTKIDIKKANERTHRCECVCLKNVAGYPYRLGYAKAYIDINDEVRCVYCNCLTEDPRRNNAQYSTT